MATVTLLMNYLVDNFKGQGLNNKAVVVGLPRLSHCVDGKKALRQGFMFMVDIDASMHRKSRDLLGAPISCYKLKCFFLNENDRSTLFI